MTDSNSLFSNKAGASGATTHVEDEHQDGSDEIDYLATLVGEGKKFTDTKALAKGKYHADAAIARLQDEARAKDAEIARLQDMSQKFDRVLEKISSSATSPVAGQGDTNPGGRDGNSPVTNVGMKPEEVENLVSRQITANLERVQHEANLKSVQRDLTKAWGGSYASKITARVNELGLDPKTIDALARTSPKAAVALLMGQSPSSEADTSFAPPRSSTVSSTLNSNSGKVDPKKNFAYYDNLRRTKPSLYSTPAIQAERIAQVSALGDAFYS